MLAVGVGALLELLDVVEQLCVGRLPFALALVLVVAGHDQIALGLQLARVQGVRQLGVLGAQRVQLVEGELLLDEQLVDVVFVVGVVRLVSFSLAAQLAAQSRHVHLELLVTLAQFNDQLDDVFAFLLRLMIFYFDEPILLCADLVVVRFVSFVHCSC